MEGGESEREAASEARRLREIGGRRGMRARVFQATESGKHGRRWEEIKEKGQKKNLTKVIKLFTLVIWWHRDESYFKAVKQYITYNLPFLIRETPAPTVQLSGPATTDHRCNLHGIEYNGTSSGHEQWGDDDWYLCERLASRQAREGVFWREVTSFPCLEMWIRNFPFIYMIAYRALIYK